MQKDKVRVLSYSQTQRTVTLWTRQEVVEKATTQASLSGLLAPQSLGKNWLILLPHSLCSPWSSSVPFLIRFWTDCAGSLLSAHWTIVQWPGFVRDSGSRTPFLWAKSVVSCRMMLWNSRPSLKGRNTTWQDDPTKVHSDLYKQMLVLASSQRLKTTWNTTEPG